MFTVEIDKVMTVTMRNCGPRTSGHKKYGDRIYRNVSRASWKRFVRWALNGHWNSHSSTWWNCYRFNASEVEE